MGENGRTQRESHGDVLDSDNNANAVTVAIHDRMPVILNPGATTCGLIRA